MRRRHIHRAVADYDAQRRSAKLVELAVGLVDLLEFIGRWRRIIHQLFFELVEKQLIVQRLEQQLWIVGSDRIGNRRAWSIGVGGRVTLR